jgi:hypothetical protein
LDGSIHKKSPNALSHPGLVSQWRFYLEVFEQTSCSMTAPSPETLGLGGSSGHGDEGMFHAGF